MKMNKLASTLVGLLAFGSAGSALATGGTWDSAAPWDSTAIVIADWNVFADDSPGAPLTDSTPDLGGAGVLSELSGAAFVTGGGNIYSFSAPTSFSVVTAALGSVSDVWLRAATLGTLPIASATLNGVGATLVTTYTESLGGFGGAEKESYWKWSAVSAAPSYTFGFGSVESSMSLDQLSVAAVAAPVPEPATLSMLAAGLLTVGMLARRRRSEA